MVSPKNSENSDSNNLCRQNIKPDEATVYRRTCTHAKGSPGLDTSDSSFKTEFPRSVIVQTNEGNSYRRNFHHLQRSKAEIPSTRSTESSESGTETSYEHEEGQSEPKSNRVKKTKSGRTIKPVQRYQAV